MSWTPIGRDPTAVPTLTDGIPAWLRRGIADWLKYNLHTHPQSGYGAKKTALVQEFDQLAQLHKPLAEIFEDNGFQHLEHALFTRQDEMNLYIQFLDFLVNNLSAQYGGSVQTDALDRLLENGGSKWRVGTRFGNVGLEERVPAGVLLAADALMGNPGHAGALLAEAWQAAFGVNPDHEKAYSKAIKAVEAAAVPVVSPKNGRATLGTVITDMKNQNDWKLAMTREHPDAMTKDVVLGMTQALWTGQNDRHAGQAGYTPSTQAEAEAAVMLAVPLVQWFVSGALARR